MLDVHYTAQEGCLQSPLAWSGSRGCELRSVLLNSQWEELRFTVSTLRYSVIPSGHGECPCCRETRTSGSVSVQETWPIASGLHVSVASSASSWSRDNLSLLGVWFVVGTALRILLIILNSTILPWAVSCSTHFQMRKPETQRLSQYYLLKNMKGFDFKHNINLSLYRKQSTMCACGRYVCVGVCSVCTCAHAYMEARGHWVATSITIQFIPLRQSLFTEFETMLAASSPSDAPVSASFSAEVTVMYDATSGFHGHHGIWTQVLKLVEQVFLSTEPSPQPPE